MMLSVRDLSVTQGAFRLRSVDFDISCGVYAVLMGRTGSGKTTLLEALCGLRPLEGGTIQLGERRIHALRPGARGIGLVPQDGALFPTLTVREQIEFGPRVHQWPRDRITEKVGSLADATGITHLLDRHPTGLSGGERQRIALARALAIEPQLLCLDEPLSALDEPTREDMCELLNSLQQTMKFTALHVTHSQTEAERMGDIILRMEELAGQLE